MDGKLVENALIERKNGSLSKQLMDPYLFYSLDQLRLFAEGWSIFYNHERLHETLGFMPLAEYIKNNYFVHQTANTLNQNDPITM